MVINTQFSDAEIALEVQGTSLSTFGAQVLGVTVHIGNSLFSQLRFDEDEIQSAESNSDEVSDMKINGRGGNVIIGFMTGSKVGINTLGTTPL